MRESQRSFFCASGFPQSRRGATYFYFSIFTKKSIEDSFCRFFEWAVREAFETALPNET